MRLSLSHFLKSENIKGFKILHIQTKSVSHFFFSHNIHSIHQFMHGAAIDSTFRRLSRSSQVQTDFLSWLCTAPIHRQPKLRKRISLSKTWFWFPDSSTTASATMRRPCSGYYNSLLTDQDRTITGDNIDYSIPKWKQVKSANTNLSHQVKVRLWLSCG